MAQRKANNMTLAITGKVMLSADEKQDHVASTTYRAMQTIPINRPVSALSKN